MKSKTKRRTNNKLPNELMDTENRLVKNEAEVGSQVEMSESGPQVQAPPVISPGDVRHSMVSLVTIPAWIFEHC